MLYNFQRKNLCKHLLVGGALLAASFGMYSCSDAYNLDTEQPSNLNSIYGYMQQQGNFTNYLRLIDELGQKDILSKTGSKTVFIADDEAFAKFYASNPWRVKRFEDLSPAQKKLLLGAAMIDNPYSTSMLSTAEGPTRGEVCRRSSSLTLYDSILEVKSKTDYAYEVLPHNARFDELQHNHDSLVIYTDASNAAPMVHFNYKFIASNKLQSSDIDFLYNQAAGTRGNEDVYVNNAKVIKPNIFCKNGFIHQVDRVIIPFDNMADIIRKEPKLSSFNSIIERFAAPEYSRTLTDAYNVNRNKDVDSVFNRRYFSDRSAGSTRETDKAFEVDKNGDSFDASLKFDPGWNGYMPLSGDPRNAMMEDLAVMLVPTNEAMKIWMGEDEYKDDPRAEGKPIIDQYHSLKETPNSVLDDLVRVNQLASLVSSVPSRFSDVLDDSNEPLGITLADIDSVIIGCNGVIYMTNKVFAPKSYSSVLFPAVIDTTNFKIIENAISCLDYDKYLNSMVSRYIFVIPTNKGLLTYIDPVSYGQTESNMWEFHFDPTKTKNKRIYADVYKCTLDPTGEWVKGEKVYTVKDQDVAAHGTALYDRLSYILDNIIVVTAYTPGQKYYRTKGNTFVRVEGVEEGDLVYGSFQNGYNKPLVIKKSYPMHNGYALIADGVIMGTNKSVAMNLSENSEFSEFLAMMQACGAVSNSNGKDKWAAAASQEGLGNLFNLKEKGEVGAEDLPAGSTMKATYLLNNFHYTIYAPTNAAMQYAYEHYGLPSLLDLEAAELYDMENENTDSAAHVKEAMLDFVKYHIQDNSCYIEDKDASVASYETAKTELIPSTTVDENVEADKVQAYKDNGSFISASENEDGTFNVEYRTGKYSPGRPYKIKVEKTKNALRITDVLGNSQDVITSPGMYNIQATEYWIGNKNEGTSTAIMAATANAWDYYICNSSSAVIHGINKPLVYSLDQFKYKYKPLTNGAKRR